MTLGNICTFKTNFLGADFWLIRKGNEKVIGTPTKEFSEESIGVKIKEEFQDKIDPNYLYYYFKFLHQQGMFSPMAHGTLELKNITISDIKSIPVNFY
jgi:hypothetical protein